MAANNQEQPKRINVLSLDKRVRTLEAVVIELVKVNADLESRLVAFETGRRSTLSEPGINKVETHNGERTPPVKDGMKMDDEHKLQSLVNAIKVLPPNFVEDGRHSLENIEALAGFKVSPEMLEDLYSKWKHIGNAREGFQVVPVN